MIETMMNWFMYLCVVLGVAGLIFAAGCIVLVLIPEAWSDAIDAKFVELKDWWERK